MNKVPDTSIDQKTKDLLDSFPERTPDENTPLLLFTSYSRTSHIFRSGGRLYGNWSASFAAACSSGTPSSIYESSVLNLEDVGECSPGERVTMCEHR
jgi:hypothetical protein